MKSNISTMCGIIVINNGEKEIATPQEFKDRKEVKDFCGHVGFYVDFNNEKIRKDLFYWSKNSVVVPF